MKYFALLVIAVLALAAVPVALADTGQNAGDRAQRIQQRIQLVEQRFVKHCGTAASTAPGRCVAFANRVEQRLGRIDTRLQELIQKRQQAGKDVAGLTKLDAAIQALAQKVHAWLSA
jgi:hypothetical protein